MNNNNKILIVYGSLNSVPSPEGAAPAKVIEDTVRYLDKEKFQVVSNFNEKLQPDCYDNRRFKHVKPSFLDKLFLFYFKSRYRYLERKDLFITAQDSQLLFFIALSRYIKKKKIEKVIVHVSPGLVQMIKLFNPLSKIIFYHHGTSLHVKLSESNWKRLLKNTDAIFGVNQIAKDLANTRFKTKLSKNNYFKIGNGVEAVHSKTIDKLSTDNFTVMFSGRICKEKGVLELLKAYKIIKEKNHNISLVIAGHVGTKRGLKEGNAYLKICKEYIIENNLDVNFTGFLSQEELYKWYQRINILILPTDPLLSSEGMSLSLLEAMSIGKPLIATNIGGNPEVIEHGYNGFLIYNKEDYSFEIAEKIEQLYLDKNLEQRMIDNAFLKYNNGFTAKNMSLQFMNALKSIGYVD